ncbi:MAG: MBL fold metallo-hydrolase [Defluviicoccus sp.]|nr:MBL fold metallo-hydrolase [Defluviicoccus sp.]MDE0386224.1 MBL fold metallo-hydrolase [Defluviicoccus sp.]
MENRHVFYPGEPLEEGAMRVTLLGTGTPFPRRGQAAAGMFVEAGAHKMLLDVGPGTPANFTSLQIPFDEVDKIFLTHHHVDHIGGLDQFWIGGWTYGRRRPLKVWGPPGTADIVAHLRGIYEWDIETRRRVFDTLQGSEIEAVDYGEGVVWEEDGIRVTTFEVVHTPPHNTFGLRIDHGGRSMVFSGDTKKCDALIARASGVDLLIHEAFPPVEVYADKAGRPIELARIIAEEVHTAPREVGEVLAASRPRLGVIYHMYNNDDVIGPALAQVREGYDGRVEIGYDLMVIDIADEMRVRPAAVSDKPWPVRRDRPAGH